MTASTRTFYRVTAPKTVTIIPDTPAKRREYEESVVATFFLSNADIKEVIDLLRIVVDVRQISPITTGNSISLKDTPERIEAAGKLIAAIDKARPEVVIDVELLEIDRSRLLEYGLQIASPLPEGTEGSPTGISGAVAVNPPTLSLEALRNLTAADVFITGVPAIYYKLLKNDANTRTLANPQLRTSEGIAAQARFGDRVPVPATVFAPIATGGINQQPITSFVYENIGVNIDILPRTHHNDEVSLSLKVTLSNISGSGFGGLPTFGNREITTTIRLKDGETNMLAGLIRDDERTVLSGIPGLVDLPIIGRLFASNRRESQETDIVLTLTPHIVRVLDLSESDLRPFRLGRDVPGGAAPAELPNLVPRDVVPRDREVEPGATGIPPVGPPVTGPTTPAFPQPLQPPGPFPQPLQGPLPGREGSCPDAATSAEEARRRPLASLVSTTAPSDRKTLDERRVSTLDRLERRDPALPFRRQRRRDQRHPRPQVTGIQQPPSKLGRTADDDAVRIAKKQIGAHGAELLEGEEPQLVEPVVHERPALRLRRKHRHEADHVARKPGPEAGRQPPRRGQRRWFDGEPVVFVRAPQPHVLERRGDDLDVCGARSRHQDVSAGDRRDDPPAAGLDVVACELVSRCPGTCFGASMRIVVVPSPSTDTPIARRNRHSSTTCGSMAAWRISVRPRARAAASSAVSVPVTEASSRYIDAPLRPFGASSAWPGSSSGTAPIAISAWRWVAIVRRAGKSPPGWREPR